LPPNIVKLKVSDELNKFVEDIGRPVPEIIEGLSKSWAWIPPQYLEQLKEGPMESVFREVFSVSEIGRPIDRDIRSFLKIEGFRLDDVDINFDDQYFFFAYSSADDEESKINTVYVNIGKEGPCYNVQEASSPLD